VYYSTTLGDLKMKLSKSTPLKPENIELRKEGQRLVKDNCFLMYYGISNGTTLEAVEVKASNLKTTEEENVPLFLQLSTGFVLKPVYLIIEKLRGEWSRARSPCDN
jgi:Ubiquitin family